MNETITFSNFSVGFGIVIHKVPAQNFTLPAIFIWDFDDSDGIKGDAVGTNVTHVYTKPGAYNVTVIAIVSLNEQFVIEQLYVRANGWSEGPYPNVYVNSDKITVTVTE